MLTNKGCVSHITVLQAHSRVLGWKLASRIGRLSATRFLATCGVEGESTGLLGTCGVEGDDHSQLYVGAIQIAKTAHESSLER